MAEDWKKKWDESGYYFSDDDRSRAEYDPQFRDQIFRAKELYAGGDTEGGHSLAESARRAYNYSGGVAGDEFISTPIRTNNTGDMVSDITQRMAEYSRYIDPYMPGITAKYDAIVGREPFSYDYRSDPAWQSYKKSYTREGRRASEDTLAQAAAMTGGVPSSYAQTAAQQANNYYMAQMSDKIPELYQLAYSMYADEANRNMNELNALRGLSDDMYGRWGDEFGRLGSMYDIATDERAYSDKQDANKIYAYGDGAPYEIGTGKGQAFVLNSVPGDTMTGGDGSLWENRDGQIVITRDGQTWTIGAAAPAQTWYWGGGSGKEEGEPKGSGKQMSASELEKGIMNYMQLSSISGMDPYNAAYDYVETLIDQGLVNDDKTTEDVLVKILGGK